MKITSIRNLSLLSLLLMVASAVTAAISAKSKSKPNSLPGAFVIVSWYFGSQLTCIGKPIGAQSQCDYTATDWIQSYTSEGLAITSFDAFTTGHGVQIDQNRPNYSNTGIVLVNGLYVSEE